MSSRRWHICRYISIMRTSGVCRGAIRQISKILINIYKQKNAILIEILLNLGANYFDLEGKLLRGIFHCFGQEKFLKFKHFLQLKEPKEPLSGINGCQVMALVTMINSQLNNNFLGKVFSIETSKVNMFKLTIKNVWKSCNRFLPDVFLCPAPNPKAKSTTNLASAAY